MGLMVVLVLVVVVVLDLVIRNRPRLLFTPPTDYSFTDYSLLPWEGRVVPGAPLPRVHRSPALAD
jgi:hypothetical protein